MSCGRGNSLNNLRGRYNLEKNDNNKLMITDLEIKLINQHLAELKRIGAPSETAIELERQRDEWRDKFNQLADDALVALAGHVPTPEKGFKAEPHCLKNCINNLVMQYDKCRRKLGVEKAVVGELRKHAAWPGEGYKLLITGTYLIEGDEMLDAAGKIVPFTLADKKRIRYK